MLLSLYVGLDELSPVGTADVVEVTEDKTIKEWTFDPTDYHIPFCSIGDLKGSTADANASVLREVFGGSDTHEAIGNALAINAGVGLWLTGDAPTIADGIAKCRGVLQSGQALRFLNSWAEWSNGHR
eukprot:GHVS01095316.1.p1 GENE.GHVS01095316.1~~GHVS01095316.1.p1  ORF type:complete len:127 (-),score=22.79 GHVS01095316.1:128-508(-)